MARVLDWQSRGREFESLQLHHRVGAKFALLRFLFCGKGTSARFLAPPSARKAFLGFAGAPECRAKLRFVAPPSPRKVTVSRKASLVNALRSFFVACQLFAGAAFGGGWVYASIFVNIKHIGPGYASLIIPGRFRVGGFFVPFHRFSFSPQSYALREFQGTGTCAPPHVVSIQAFTVCAPLPFEKFGPACAVAAPFYTKPAGFDMFFRLTRESVMQETWDAGLLKALRGRPKHHNLSQRNRALPLAARP